MKSYGKVHVETALNAESFAALIGALNLKPPVLIKPNWGTVECYSEAQVLDWTLAAIPGEKIVIESHGWARNEETLHNQGPVGLTKANLRKGDRWFLEYTGIDRVLEKHNVEYLNLTEEIWAGRGADPALIQQAVEEKFTPAQFADLYAKVPARLYELRGGTLLSLAKYKIVFYPLGISMAVKNLFGLIPGPSRGKFHGKAHAFLDQSIVDINKIYHSLFAVKGVVEAAFSAGYLENEWEPTQVFPGGGKAFASKDSVALDAFATALHGRDPNSVGHLRLAAQTFGGWDESLCADAEQSGIKVIVR
jgi:uncharacterized protein (DUF362 family)